MTQKQAKACLSYLFHWDTDVVHCTVRVAEWRPISNHWELPNGSLTCTVGGGGGGWFSLHSGGEGGWGGSSSDVPIRRTAHCFHVMPANDTKESVLGHRNTLDYAYWIDPDTASCRGKCSTTELPVTSVVFRRSSSEKNMRDPCDKQ